MNTPRITPESVMRRLLIVVMGGAVAAAVLIWRWSRERPADQAAGQAGESFGGLVIQYPFHETIFPPDMSPPTFRWEDANPQCRAWRIDIASSDGRGALGAATSARQWAPSPQEWKRIKDAAPERWATVRITGHAEPGGPETPALSGDAIRIMTSRDEVGAPILYREVNLPFSEAVKDPSKIRWRFGPVSSVDQPPVVLTDLPVCGNCHSFSADGRHFGMDVDYANDKGSYAITAVARQVDLSDDRIITWSDYRRQDGEPTFGLLSQLSPDGRHAVSTVKDRSVFVATPPLEFSQLFFPIKGVLCVYSVGDRTFRSLPGADDPAYVQSNPSWSPDGRYLVFARSRAYQLETATDKDRVLLKAEECREFIEGGKTFKFDLYRVPFNDGRGGTPAPLEGASNNGMSNYFAKYSPDGRWIVFCQARSFMLLQPDSELYIIPAEGGRARRLACNTVRMNSWHSWSPNSRWLVFSSKAYSAYTQLFLTHIDEQGQSSPPVLLERFTSPDRAANIPEFVNAEASAITEIAARFVDDESQIRAGNRFSEVGDFVGAVRRYEQAAAMNPRNAQAHWSIGGVKVRLGRVDEAIPHFRKAIEVNPGFGQAYVDLGLMLAHQGDLEEGGRQVAEGVKHDPRLAEDAASFARQAGRCGQAGQLREALFAAEKAFCFAAAAGQDSLAETMKRQIIQYKQAAACTIPRRAE